MAQRFGRYLLLDKVASGGMAEVWRVKLLGEKGFQRIYAIKKILPHIAEDEDFIRMFTDEALIASSLQHANIGQVYEFSKVDDTFFIGMEYISGKDLKAVWSAHRARRSVLPFGLSAYIAQKIADGLDYAHRRTDNHGDDAGIVHRDVSPQNVLLSWDGEVKIVDFGIAKAAEKSTSLNRNAPGAFAGKLAYMSPEQVRGAPLDGRSDVFAIGVVLYELLTGVRAFTGNDSFSLLEKVRHVELPPPTVVNRAIPAALEHIVYRCLTKAREQRYATAADLSEDLQRFMMSRDAGPRPPSHRELAAHLRAEFTVDFDNERARLESYKQITEADVEQLRGGSSESLRDRSGAAVPLTGDDETAPLRDTDELDDQELLTSGGSVFTRAPTQQTRT